MLFKMDIQTKLYVTQNIWQWFSRKNKVTLIPNKPANIGISILELSKVLIFTETDSLMYEIKTEDVYEDFSNDKEIFESSNYSTSQKMMIIQTN